MKQVSRLALLLAVAIAVMARASALEVEQVGKAGPVDVVVREVWPKRAAFGWMPVQVQLHNTGTRAERVDIALEMSEIGSTRVARSLEVAPGERRIVELVVPLFGTVGYGGGASALVTVGAAGQEVNCYGYGPSEANFSDVKPVLVLRRQRADAGDEARWSRALSTAVAATPRAVENQNRWGGLTGVVVGTAPSTGDDNVPVAAALYSDAPRRVESWSSLAAVVLDRPQGAIDDESLDSLAAWMRLGGLVVVLGEGATSFAQRDPRLAEWAQERFRVEDGRSVALYAAGLGGLIVTDAKLEDALVGADALRFHLRAWRSFPAHDDQRTINLTELEGLGEPPYLGFALLLLLFTIVIGPVNFVWVRRMKRPALLLISIPAISAAFTIGLLLFGILGQGIDTRESVVETALLDQRANRVEVLTNRHLYVGFAHQLGLRPGPASIVTMDIPVASDSSWRVADGEKRVLSGAFMPVRDPVRHLVQSERASRLGLEVKREGEALVVVNRLEGVLSNLLVRGQGEDEWWLSDATLQPGARARLEAVPRAQAEDRIGEWRLTFGRGTVPIQEYLTSDCWLADVDRGQFSDDLGLGADPRAGLYGVVGLLAEGATR